MTSTALGPPRTGPSDVPGRAAFDAVSFLTVFLVLLFAMPSHLTVSAFGSLGHLHVVWGLLGLSWWAYVRLQHSTTLPAPTTPVKAAVLSFFGTVMLSYGVAQLRGLPSEDGAWADSALVRALSWAGVVLVALDGIHDRERLMCLVRRVIWSGALMAVLGLAQFATGQALVDSITLPGFNPAPELPTVFEREGYTRAAGTASHPLAYGSVLVTILPLAVSSGIVDTRVPALVRWVPAGLLAVAALMSMSRSVIVSVVVGLLLVVPTVPRRYLGWTLGMGSVLTVGVSMAVPGMFGALRAIFGDLGDDAGSISRTDSAGAAVGIALRNPVLGRGLGTFMPTELILDNQWLMVFIDLGVIGLVTFALMAVASQWAGWTMFRNSVDARDRHLGPAVAAGLTSGFVNMAFYDALSFPIAAGLHFLMLGVMGAALSLSREAMITDGPARA